MIRTALVVAGSLMGGMLDVLVAASETPGVAGAVLGAVLVLGLRIDRKVDALSRGMENLEERVVKLEGTENEQEQGSGHRDYGEV